MNLYNLCKLIFGVLCILAIILTEPVSRLSIIIYLGLGAGGIILIKESLEKEKN